MPSATAGPAEADQPFSDDELTALALAADPDAGLSPDAVSLWDLERPGETELLPAWYMPAPMRRSSSPWARLVIGLVVAAFLVIDAAGLCSTYGWVSLG